MYASDLSSGCLSFSSVARSKRVAVEAREEEDGAGAGWDGPARRTTSDDDEEEEEEEDDDESSIG